MYYAVQVIWMDNTLLKELPGLDNSATAQSPMLYVSHAYVVAFLSIVVVTMELISVQWCDNTCRSDVVDFMFW
jgi:hypothetical protein